MRGGEEERRIRVGAFFSPSPLFGSLPAFEAGEKKRGGKKEKGTPAKRQLTREEKRER